MPGLLLVSARRFAVAACLLLLASCSRPDSANFPRGGDATEAPAAAGDEFFEFSASRLGGGQVTGWPYVDPIA
ncbi:MAG TPA: hypothetical protein VHJ78_05495, partial [Actinomycetota bacterium]|nr:hypothetical protein [Actinomycetota bacterium]